MRYIWLGLAITMITTVGCNSEKSTAPEASKDKPLAQETDGKIAEPIEAATPDSSKAPESTAHQNTQVQKADATEELSDNRGLKTPMTGFKRPDSIIYDERYDRYIVSNLGGGEWDKSNKGSLSVIDRKSGEVTHEWAAGSENHLTLNAPRGMAVWGRTLAVADGSFIRIFDRKTGGHQGSFEVPGAHLLDSVAVALDGTFYVTESAWKTDWSPAKGSGIYKLKDGVMLPVIIDEKLAHPGGLVVRDELLWAVSSKTGKITAITLQGEIEKEIEVEGFGLRGLAVDSDGDFLISSTRNGTVLKGPPEGPFTPLVKASGGAGGIGYDRKRNQLLLPITEKQYVEIPKFGK